jgi:predicted RNase H-like HicB family nuclease
MKSTLNILIEKDETGYSASCSAIEGYQVKAKSLDIVVDSLKEVVKNYLENKPPEMTENTVKPIWEIAQELIKDVSDDEVNQLPADGAEQHDHYIYGTPKHL